MNRRELLPKIAATASMVFAALTPARSELVNRTPTSKEDWDREIFGRSSAEDAVHLKVITDFIAAHPAIYLFKNRLGQFVFQIHDPAAGAPTTKEALFLVKGRPTGLGGFILPSHLQVIHVEGASIVGIEYDPRDTLADTKSNLARAYKLLKI